VVWACERALDLAEGDDRARVALRLGRINQFDHPGDAEDAYHAAIAEPGAHRDTRVATAFAAERAAISRVTRIRDQSLPD
jgi:hypothetical protein